MVLLSTSWKWDHKKQIMQRNTLWLCEKIQTHHTFIRDYCHQAGQVQTAWNSKQYDIETKGRSKTTLTSENVVTVTVSAKKKKKLLANYHWIFTFVGSYKGIKSCVCHCTHDESSGNKAELKRQTKESRRLSAETVMVSALSAVCVIAGRPENVCYIAYCPRLSVLPNLETVVIGDSLNPHPTVQLYLYTFGGV